MEPTNTPIGPGSPLGSPSTGKGSRRMLGCVVGCLVMAVGAVGLFASMWWWISSPGPQVATEPMVPEDAVAALRVEGLGEDEGFTELALAALMELDRAGRELQASQLPDNLRWLSAFRGRRPRASQLAKWLPREVTVVVEAAPGTEDGYSVVTAVNLARYPRLVRFLIERFFAREGGRRWEHRGVRLSSDDDTVIAFLGSTLLISDDAAATERALDQLIDAPRLGEPAARGGAAHTGVEGTRALGELAVRHPGEWDVHGGFLNEQNVLAYAWWDVFAAEERQLDLREAEPEPLEMPEPGVEEEPASTAPRLDPDFERAAAGVEASWMALDFETADRVRMVLAFRCRDAQAAAVWAKWVESDLERVRSEAGERGLELRQVSTTSGDRVDIEIEASAVREWIEEGVGGFFTDLIETSSGIEETDDAP